MFWKKAGKVLLYPHMAIMIILLPVSAVALVYSLTLMGIETPVGIGSCVLASYTLLVWCLRIPGLLRRFRAFRRANPYAVRWREDMQLRMNLSLYGTLIWNTAYGVFQMGLGFWHRSFWFFSLAGYYIALAVMRFFLLRHTRRYAPGEALPEELRRYRACGIVFLLMNLALGLMIFFMVYWNRTFVHHQITAIAMAAYTFTSFTLAIVNMKKGRRYQSPVYSASKAISLSAACVSMLTLESTMLTAFGGEEADPMMGKLMLGGTGAALTLFIVIMAVNMIVNGTKKLREWNNGEE